MANVISIFNQKGGVGKSTTTSNLMAGLTMCGKKVLALDIDSQGHLTKFCNINTNNENTIIELLFNEASFDETVKHTRFGDVIPCDRDLQGAVAKFNNDLNTMFALKEVTDSVSDKYDYVLIDCPPNANQVTTSALIASNYVIVPTEAEFFSLDGVAEIAITIQQVKKRLNEKLKVLGVLITKYQPRRLSTRKFEQNLDKVAQQMFNSKVFKSKINYTVAVPDSQSYKQSLFEYDKNSKVAKNFMAFVNEVIEGVEQ
jgi:chromosome partitioning protein